MITIKSYTDLEQSKKLVEILPIESADMFWKNGVSDKYIQCFTPFVIDKDVPNVDFDYDVPCWTLTALLSILPNYQLQTQDDGIGILCSCNGKFNIITADNTVDACVIMIEKLYELNLLRI